MYEDFKKIAQKMPLNEYGIEACKAIEYLVDTLLRRDRFIQKLEDKLFEFEGNKQPKGAMCKNCRKYLKCRISKDKEWFCADYEETN